MDDGTITRSPTGTCYTSVSLDTQSSKYYTTIYHTKFSHLKFRHPNKKSTRLQSTKSTQRIQQHNSCRTKTLRAPLCTAWPCPSRFACFRSPRDAKLSNRLKLDAKKEQGEIAAKLCQGCVSIYIYIYHVYIYTSYNITYNHLHK